jgi:Fe-S-cluster containining protein
MKGNMEEEVSTNDKQFPEGMEPLGKEPFTFACHPEVPCFTVCCRRVDMILYPYDILRLKTSLQLHSEEFMRRYTYLVKGDNPFFPTVKLKLLGEEEGVCPFLKEEGCSVYQDRPSACRTYPLERAVDRTANRGRAQDFYFLTHHEYCKGHFEDKEVTVDSFVRHQGLLLYNSMNDLWAEMDTLFGTNPWKGEGAAGERQQLAFMVCYNVDGFRSFVEQHRLLRQFRLSKDERRRIEREDVELQKFGFAWLRLFLTGSSSLIAA